MAAESPQPSAPSAPAGFYLDPHRQGWLREWTGSAWADNWRPVPTEEEAPPSQARGHDFTSLDEADDKAGPVVPGATPPVVSAGPCAACGEASDSPLHRSVCLGPKVSEDDALRGPRPGPTTTAATVTVTPNHATSASDTVRGGGWDALSPIARLGIVAGGIVIALTALGMFVNANGASQGYIDGYIGGYSAVRMGAAVPGSAQRTCENIFDLAALQPGGAYPFGDPKGSRQGCRDGVNDAFRGVPARYVR